MDDADESGASGAGDDSAAEHEDEQAGAQESGAELGKGDAAALSAPQGDFSIWFVVQAPCCVLWCSTERYVCVLICMLTK